MQEKNNNSSTELDQIIAANIASQSDQSTVIHAGHFALVQRDSAVSDCLNETRFPEVGMGFATFAKLTWQAACRVAANDSDPRQLRLMVLVNDWQYVAAKGASRKQVESVAARGRDQYYRQVSRLPDFHLASLAEFGLNESIVLRHDDDQWLWSELALRNDLNLLLQGILCDPVKTRESGLSKHFNIDGEPVVEACDDETGTIRLLYCGNTNCAGEVVSLLHRLYFRGVRNFVNLFPSQCNHPVGVGTRIAYKLFGLQDMHVTNVAVQDGAVIEAENSIHVEHFTSL